MECSVFGPVPMNFSIVCCSLVRFAVLLSLS